MARFLLSCGGTGGHLAPGIALAEGLVARGHEVTLLISRKGIDARLSSRYPAFRFEPLPGTPFSASPLAFLRCVWTQSQGVVRCLRLIRGGRVDGVVGFGGFTSAPLVVAGRLLGVPVALHESNRVPGLAVRTLGRWARRVYLPAGVALPHLRPGVVREAGLPVRREITPESPGEARAALGLDPRRRTVVVLGGSQGASALNDWARAAAPELARMGVQLLAVTGPGKGEATVSTHPDLDGVLVTSRTLPFSDRMATLLSAADVVVSRAGAGTIGELIRCATPAILVPYPQAADDHQRANAGHLAREGGGLVVSQDELPRLLDEVRALLADEARRLACRAQLKRLDATDPLGVILADLEALIGVRRASAVAAPPAAA